MDPNALSPDGTSAVNPITVSPDGSKLAYVRSDGGSDCGHFYLVDLATDEPIDDIEIVSKFSVPTLVARQSFVSLHGVVRAQGDREDRDLLRFRNFTCGASWKSDYGGGAPKSLLEGMGVSRVHGRHLSRARESLLGGRG